MSVQIEGKNMLTIEVASGENYEIDYHSARNVGILNTSDGLLKISTTKDFETTEDYSECVEINDLYYYNNMYVDGGKLYLSAEGVGLVSIYVL